MDTTNIFSLKNKVIVVTGGTGILGGAFVKGIANAGGAVVILGRNSTVGNERADEINASGGDAIFIAVDVLEEADLLKAKEIILEKYGKIDGLVNAAGGNIPEAVVQPDADIFNMNIDGNKFLKILIECGISYEQLKDYEWSIEECAPHKYHCIGVHPVAKRIDVIKEILYI